MYICLLCEITVSKLHCIIYLLISKGIFRRIVWPNFKKAKSKADIMLNMLNNISFHY